MRSVTKTKRPTAAGERSKLLLLTLLGRVPVLYLYSGSIRAQFQFTRLLSVQVVVPHVDAGQDLLDAATALVLHEDRDQVLGTHAAVGLALELLDILLGDHVLVAIFVVGQSRTCVRVAQLHGAVLGGLDHIGVVLEQVAVGQIVQAEALQQVGDRGREEAATGAGRVGTVAAGGWQVDALHVVGVDDQVGGSGTVRVLLVRKRWTVWWRRWWRMGMPVVRVVGIVRVMMVVMPIRLVVRALAGLLHYDDGLLWAPVALLVVAALKAPQESGHDLGEGYKDQWIMSKDQGVVFQYKLSYHYPFWPCCPNSAGQLPGRRGLLGRSRC